MRPETLLGEPGARRASLATDLSAVYNQARKGDSSKTEPGQGPRSPGGPGSALLLGRKDQAEREGGAHPRRSGMRGGGGHPWERHPCLWCWTS